MNFSEREIAIARPPENISTAEWGERNIELSILTSARAGRWSLAMIPFMRPVLDWLDDEDIESVCLAKSTQIAGTQTFLTWIARNADQDPGPAMVVFADEDTSKEICDRRIQPMIRSCIPLAKHIDEKKFNKDSIQLLNNFSLTMAWASSIAKTASRPIRYILMDEICKPSYGRSQDEGSVIRRIEQRAETFPNRKIVKLSTVTIEGDNMDKEMKAVDVIYDWHVPCPKCGAEQPLRFRPTKYRNAAGQDAMTGSVVFNEKGTIPERAESARYQCGECAEMWTTAEKNAAVARGRALPRTEITRKPKHIGYHISRLYSLFPGGRLESLAESFLKAEGDPMELQSFVNNSLAEHWKTYRVTSSEEQLREAMCAVQKSMVPDGADCLTLSIDMQQTGFWYLIRAWSATTRQSWMIECGTMLDWDEVKFTAFERTWERADGSRFVIWRTMIDSGGTKADGAHVSRTEELYSFWMTHRQLAYRRMFLCKGSSRAMPTAISTGRILETTPSGKKIEHGGLQIIEVNSILLKDRFFSQLEQARKQESRAAYLHAGTPDAYFRHITAEAKDEDGTYKRLRVDNHWLDCEMMQQAAVSDELFGGLGMVARVVGAKKTQVEQSKTTEENSVDAKPIAAIQKPKPTMNPFAKGLRR